MLLLSSAVEGRDSTVVTFIYAFPCLTQDYYIHVPLYENIYYPIEQDEAQVSAILNIPCMPNSVTPPIRMPSSTHGTLFKFRPRRESVDWRRIGAIDVDRLANELDFQTLQDNILGITFCNIENEKCQHCHSSLDPVLIKLLRLAQFTIEYLLHSQEFLTSNLQALEEKVRVAMNESDQLQIKLSKQTAEMKSLKEECKMRKKMIAAQQMMISATAGSAHECQHCEKSFVNYGYLKSHMKRRHAEDIILGAKEKQTSLQFNKLHHEINSLKEELHNTKTQLEAEQAAHLEKLSQLQESEQKKTVELDVLKKFDKWKAEEREKFEEEVKKVKEMFMKELKELTEKNSCLENELHEVKRQTVHRKSGLGTLEESPYTDTGQGKSKCQHDIENVKELLEKQEEKWRLCINELKQEYDREKNHAIQQLQQEHVREKNQVIQLLQKEFDREKNQVFHQLQQERDKERKENNQLKELSIKLSPVVKKYSEPTLGQSLQHAERKQSVTTSITKVSEQAHMLEPIQELAEEKDLAIEEQGPIKYHVRDEVKKDQLLKNKLREVIEQGLEEKLEILGVTSNSRGIPSDMFQKIMDAREKQRISKDRVFPGIQKIYEQLSKHVTQMAEERLSKSFSCGSTSQHFTHAKPFTLGSTSSSTPPRQRKAKTSILKASQEELPAEIRYPVPIKSSTPRTPPFSSDDESEGEDVPLQSYKQSDSLKSSSKARVGFAANESDSDGSLLEEIKPQPSKSNGLLHAPAKPARATQVREQDQQPLVTKSTGLANHKAGNSGDARPSFVKQDPVMELKVTDLDYSDFGSSSLDEEPYEVPRPVKIHKETTVHKKEDAVTSFKKANAVTKLLKDTRGEGDTSSTLVSSLVTVSDFSDTSDI
ncbi:cilium assembly protein DZIP1 isoform X3 [Hyperolius riggenbachi]|uniref:cilium assembly protein DZIP1 isoform X3 n=1 Tax=Hyperolius riggenbachi TaxID=752182 RepID=UPI0035A3CFE0